MTTVAINQALILGLAALFAPLSLLWAYALYDSTLYDSGAFYTL